MRLTESMALSDDSVVDVIGMRPNHPPIEAGDDDGDRDFAAEVMTSTVPLAPPTPSGRRDDRRTSLSMDHPGDDSASPPTMHTPMLTHYVNLPDRELYTAPALVLVNKTNLTSSLSRIIFSPLCFIYAHAPQSTSESWMHSYLTVVVGHRARHDPFPVVVK